MRTHTQCKDKLKAHQQKVCTYTRVCTLEVASDWVRVGVDMECFRAPPCCYQVELEEGHRVELAQQQTRAQKACRLLTYLRTNILIMLLVVGAISAIFWATKYSQDNKEVQDGLYPFLYGLFDFLV